MPEYKVRTGYSFFIGEGTNRQVKIGGNIIKMTADGIKGQEWKVEEVKETLQKAMDEPTTDKAVKNPKTKK